MCLCEKGVESGGQSHNISSKAACSGTLVPTQGGNKREKYSSPGPSGRWQGGKWTPVLLNADQYIWEGKVNCLPFWHRSTQTFENGTFWQVTWRMVASHLYTKKGYRRGEKRKKRQRNGNREWKTVQKLNIKCAALSGVVYNILPLTDKTIACIDLKTFFFCCKRQK